MGITVSFFSNTSDSRCLTKNLTLINSATCDVYEPCDRLNPVLTLDANTIDGTDVNGIVSCNYCAIPEFGRWYFIENIISERGKKIEIYCHVDVLETYRDQIKECECIAARSSSNYNTYLEDQLLLSNSYSANRYWNIGEPIGSCDTPVMITIGKGSGIDPPQPEVENDQEGGE